MNVIVFGSTGKTGLEIIKKLLSEGHKVTAFARNPSALDISDENLITAAGDIFDRMAIKDAIKNHNAAVVALGSGLSLGKTTVRSEGTANVLQAMKENSINRIVIISAMGVGESWKDLSVINRLFFATLLKNSRTDHEAQERHVKESGLDWTIIRPSGLTDDPGTGSYESGSGIRSKTSRVSRADVAHLVSRALEDSTYIRKAVTITN